MNTRRMLALSLVAGLLPASVAAAPAAAEFQGVTIGAKLRTTPVEFKTKVGLAGGGSLAPGFYDVEVASTGDKSRVLLLFYQKGRKMGETPGVLKVGTRPGAIIAPCGKAGIVRSNCSKVGQVMPCNGIAKDVMPCDGAKNALSTNQKGRYLTFEQLGFAGGVKPSLRAGAGGGTLLTIPGTGGSSVEAQLPAVH